MRLQLFRCCPHCHSLEVRRSHRKGLFEVLLLPLALMRPYRCKDCEKRHYNFFFSKKMPNLQQPDTTLD
jgi:hypothetical protein